MKFHISIILFSLTFFGCFNNNNTTNGNYAHVGGEIINPNTNFVILENHKNVIDTIRLDNRNRFLYKVENLERTLYTFRHGDEIQTILIEPSDSILFRLNTLEFDESLVFTGKGAKKNNYLINEFLQNEIDEKKIFKLCQLSSVDFQNHVDSIKSKKIKAFEHFKDKYQTTDLFEKIAISNINYSYYSSKEIYPFVHYGKDKAAILKSLPENFYSYRDQIDFNDVFLENYYNYNSFLRHYFSNLALQYHLKKCDSCLFKRSSLCYNLDRLNLIDSLISKPKVKNDLLYRFAINYISKSNNEEKNTAILNSFLSKSGNEEEKKIITQYTLATNNLRQGNKLPNVKIVDYNNTELEINTLINKPSVIMFWSHIHYRHFKESHHKTITLKRKYPEVNFIFINIDNYGLEKSKKSLVGNRFSSLNEYVFKDPEASKETLAVYPITKTLMLDENQNIVNGNANLFSWKFENQLNSLINNK